MPPSVLSSAATFSRYIAPQPSRDGEGGWVVGWLVGWLAARISWWLLLDAALSRSATCALCRYACAIKNAPSLRWKNLKSKKIHYSDP